MIIHYLNNTEKIKKRFVICASYAERRSCCCNALHCSLIATSFVSAGSTTATVTFAHFATVSEAFSFLTSRMRSQLSAAEFSDIRRACIEQMNSPNGAKLPPDIIIKVKSSTNVNALFDTLAESPYWSWIDIRLLSVMAAATGCVESIELLASYKKSVFTRKLIDVLSNAPNKKVKEEYYSKIVTKINKDANEMTVADLLDFQRELEEVILDINKGVCILDLVEIGSIEVHWYIPNHCVDNAYQSASIRSHMFIEVQLIWIQIAQYPVVYNPQISSSAVTHIPSPLTSAGE